MEKIKQTFTGHHTPDHEEPRPGQMKAIVYHGPKSVQLECVDCPKLQENTDILVRVTATTVSPGFATECCASTIPHMVKGQILGREALGIVEQVGSRIDKFQKGDRVIISFVVACGECSYCKRREFSACNRTNESKDFAKLYGGWAPAAIFGYSSMYGNLPGSNAEYVRVPFGDANCYKVPNGVPDEKALFVADTVVSGRHAVDLGCVKQGNSVVIWGLGPVGLMAAEWCKLKGAERVIGVDHLKDRIRFAYDKMKLQVIDRTDLSSDQVEKKLLGLLPEGGADVVIDACGFPCAQGMMQKLEQKMGMQKESADVLRECLTVVRKFGHVAIIADYAGYVDAFPIGHVMMKHLTLRAGQCPAQHYFKEAMDAIEAGEIDPSVLISHHATMDQLPEMYQHLANKEEGYMKVFCRPKQV